MSHTHVIARLYSTRGIKCWFNTTSGPDTVVLRFIWWPFNDRNDRRTTNQSSRRADKKHCWYRWQTKRGLHVWPNVCQIEFHIQQILIILVLYISIFNLFPKH
jgi:hypothetical protein